MKVHTAGDGSRLAADACDFRSLCGRQQKGGKEQRAFHQYIRSVQRQASSVATTLSKMTDSQDTESQDTEDGWGEKLEEMLTALDNTRLEGGSTDSDPVSVSGDTQQPTLTTGSMTNWLTELQREVNSESQ